MSEVRTVTVGFWDDYRTFWGIVFTFILCGTIYFVGRTAKATATEPEPVKSATEPVRPISKSVELQPAIRPESRDHQAGANTRTGDINNHGNGNVTVINGPVTVVNPTVVIERPAESRYVEPVKGGEVKIKVTVPVTKPSQECERQYQAHLAQVKVWENLVK